VNYPDESGNTIEVILKNGTASRYNATEHPEILATLNHWTPPTA
jgi:hypothetical protein